MGVSVVRVMAVMGVSQKIPIKWALLTPLTSLTTKMNITNDANAKRYRYQKWVVSRHGCPEHTSVDQLNGSAKISSSVVRGANPQSAIADHSLGVYSLFQASRL